MKYKDFSELPVYKKARHLRKRIYELVKTLPSFEEYNLKLQMRKATTSVTNNIAEGNGRYRTGSYQAGDFRVSLYLLDYPAAENGAMGDREIELSHQCHLAMD